MPEITKEEMRRCFEQQDCERCDRREFDKNDVCKTYLAVVALIESSGEKQEKPKVKMDKVQEIVEECERGNGIVLLKFLRTIGVEVSEE